jgi:protease I
MEKILIFVAEEYEDMELQYPKYRLKEAGFEVVIAGEEKGKSYAGKHGYPCKSDISFTDVNAADYQALVIPGGYAPDKLRRSKLALEIVRKFHEAGKTIAFICHAGWVPISAGIVKGKKCTSFFAIKDDMVNAGVNWVDEAVAVDGNLISSRTPEDLPHFCPAIIENIKAAGRV